METHLISSSRTVSEPRPIHAPERLDLWWKDRTDGIYPLLGPARLTVLLNSIDRRGFVIVEKRDSERVCQALGLPGAMTVEVSVDVDQVVVARAAEPPSARVRIETYSGFDHPAQDREVFGAEEASFVLWQWVTTGALPAGYIGQAPPDSPHYTWSRRRQQELGLVPGSGE